MKKIINKLKFCFQRNRGHNIENKQVVIGIPENKRIFPQINNKYIEDKIINYLDQDSKRTIRTVCKSAYNSIKNPITIKLNYSFSKEKEVLHEKLDLLKNRQKHNCINLEIASINGLRSAIQLLKEQAQLTSLVKNLSLNIDINSSNILAINTLLKLFQENLETIKLKSINTDLTLEDFKQLKSLEVASITGYLNIKNAKQLRSIKYDYDSLGDKFSAENTNKLTSLICGIREYVIKEVLKLNKTYTQSELIKFSEVIKTFTFWDQSSY